MNTGKIIFGVGAIILLIYGLFFGIRGITGNIVPIDTLPEFALANLAGFIGHLMIFLTIFAVILFLGLIFLKREKE